MKIEQYFKDQWNWITENKVSLGQYVRFVENKEAVKKYSCNDKFAQKYCKETVIIQDRLIKNKIGYIHSLSSNGLIEVVFITGGTKNNPTTALYKVPFYNLEFVQSYELLEPGDNIVVIDQESNRYRLATFSHRVEKVFTNDAGNSTTIVQYVCTDGIYYNKFIMFNEESKSLLGKLEGETNSD